MHNLGLIKKYQNHIKNYRKRRQENWPSGKTVTISTLAKFYEKITRHKMREPFYRIRITPSFKNLFISSYGDYGFLFFEKNKILLIPFDNSASRYDSVYYFTGQYYLFEKSWFKDCYFKKGWLFTHIYLSFNEPIVFFGSDLITDYQPHSDPCLEFIPTKLMAWETSPIPCYGKVHIRHEELLHHAYNSIKSYGQTND